LPPEATDKDSAKKFWSKTSPMMDMPVNSIIGLPKPGSAINTDAEGLVTVKGYALPQGRFGPVDKVEVSGDEGKTWVAAELDFGGYGDLESEESRRQVKWAWCLWCAEVKVERGQKRKIVCRATDFGGNTQKEKGVWNLRGVGYNAWGETRDLTVV